VDEEKQVQLPKQLCTIRIAFPVESDEQAIEIKKKIDNVLLGIPQHKFDFNISNLGNVRAPDGR